MPKDTETSQRSQAAPEPYRKQIIYRKCGCTQCSANPDGCLQHPRTILRHLERDEDNSCLRRLLEARNAVPPDSIGPGPMPSFPPQSSGPFVLNACPDGNEVVKFSLNRGLTANAAEDPAPSSLSQSSSRTNLAEFFDSDETILEAADARALDTTYDASSSRYYLGAGSGYLERTASPSLHSPESTRRLIKAADIDCPLIHVGNSNEDSDSDSETGAENSEGLDLTDDPLYASREAIFDDILGDTTQGSVDMPVLGDLPPAFYEDKLIRNAYIDAYIAASTHHATHELVKHILDGYYQTFVAISARTGLELEGLQNMARTLRTVERRLGIDPDQLIQYHFVCDVCWYRHSPSELYELDTPACTQADCSGTLYTTKQLSDGRIKRTPVKIFPTMPIKVALQRLLLRPGRYEEFQHWRDEGDEPCCAPPSHVRGLDAFPELTTPMCDIYDGWGWRTIQAGLERRQTGQWGVADVDVLQIHQRFVSLPCGLVLIFNIDWFKSKKSPHSTGAIYISICNTPRAKRFLHDETILCCVIPGPKEPSLEQLNYVLDPFVSDVNELQNGLMLNVHGQDEPKLCHGTLYLNVSDLLASQKATGLRGVTSMGFTCSYCYQTLDALVSPTCYDSNELKMRDDWRFLKYAFIARDATPEDREVIAENRGKRWSSLDSLPSWLPAQCSPPDFMHACFLGETKHLFQEILVGNAMFHKRSRIDKPAAKLEAFLASVWWPSTSGRIPEKLVEGSSQVKADQWRNLVTILPVALYCAWEVDGMIPDSEAPRPAPSSTAGKLLAHKEATLRARLQKYLSSLDSASPADFEAARCAKVNRNYLEHYGNVLELCAAIRIWASRSISPAEALRAHDCHSRSCQSWCEMGCLLTLNFHISCHICDFILQLGPVYGWWTYPFERNNGFLGRLKHNGHTGGEVEATLMRGWVKSQLLHDLIYWLENFNEDITDDDRIMLQKLKEATEREIDPKATRRRGTLLNMIGNMMAHESGDIIKFPRQSKKVNLRALNIYGLVLRYLQDLWVDSINLVANSASVHLGEPFIARAVPSYSHVLVDGLRYGASTHHRGQGCSYAYIDGRQPVRVDYILQISQHCRDRQLPPLSCSLAIIRRFCAGQEAPDVPWALWYVDLLVVWQGNNHSFDFCRATDIGIATWLADTLGPPEAIEVSQLSGQFALATIEIEKKPYWVTMSLCHVALTAHKSTS